MRILVACEYSATVRDAFRADGHDAWSVDIVPTEGEPTFHFVGDALELLDKGWDMMVAFPPCTYLTNSNAWRWDAIAAERAEALEFVRTLMAAPIPRIAIENPAGAIGSQIRKADQYVQPWMFSEPYQKTTGLWLSGLPVLAPDVTTKPDGVRPWVQASYRTTTDYGAHRSGKERSRTFAGIAQAMAKQWGRLA